MNNMLQLWRPIKTNIITQYFGENKACINNEGNVVGKDTEFDISLCPQGYEDFYKSVGMKGHNGLDLASWSGEPVYHNANFDGWLKTEIDYMGGIGCDVISNEPILQCTEPNCYEIHYVKCRYWHLLDIFGYDKLKVQTGEPIGYSDNTGSSSGDHVHFGLKWCDKFGWGIHKDNGYFGGFNPEPYFINSFVLDVVDRKPLPLTWRQQKIKMLFNIKTKLNL